MEYIDIESGSKVFPGEYLYHKPSRDIVVCGSYDSKKDILKAIYRGKLIKDCISNFQKIKLSRSEQRAKRAERGCGGCKGKR
jgi:hypothetical protein